MTSKNNVLERAAAKNLPRVSIVTPSYNQAAFLEQTIQSVLNQNYPDLEYLIVDGASNDGSVEIIRCYENQLAWWVSEPDLGQADAINKGLRRASGEIVAWLNSDDLYQPQAIWRMVQVFEQNPQAGLVFGDVLSIDTAGNAFNVMRYGNWGLPELMTFAIIGQAGVFMRRSVLEQAGYLETHFRYMLDHHLWLKMARLASMQYVPGVVAAARYHPAAKNVGEAAGFGIEAYAVARWLENNPAYALEMARFSRQVWAGAHRFNARYLLDSGQAWNALKTYMRSFFIHPPSALKEWHRIVYAVLCLLGLKRLGVLYLKLRGALFKTRKR